MSALRLPITERARRFGYVFWNHKMDDAVRAFLGDRQMVEVWFDDSKLGEKNIDWLARRISVGYSRTRVLPDSVKEFSLKFDKKGSLRITCQ